MQFHGVGMLALISGLAGALGALAPDHWLPASMVSWQKGWHFTRASLFTGAAVVLHALFGVGIFFVLWEVFRRLDPGLLFGATVAFVVLLVALRAFRLPRIEEVFRTGPHGAWGLVAVVSILGPSEFIVPLLAKSRAMGAGYLLPLGMFLAGAAAVGIPALALGRMASNRPLWLTRGVALAGRRVTLLPFAACVALGLALLVRI